MGAVAVVNTVIGRSVTLEKLVGECACVIPYISMSHVSAYIFMLGSCQ